VEGCRDVHAAAQAIGQQLIILDVSSDRDIETAFAAFIQHGIGALLVGSGPFLNSHRNGSLGGRSRGGEFLTFARQHR
jgi:hypothetical protein